MYGSIEGVKDNLPRLAKSIKPHAEATEKLDISEKVVEGYLVEYSAIVDTALHNVYKIPLQDLEGKTPAIINMIVNNFAAYKLANRFHVSISNEENHTIMALRKDAQEMLESLVAGTYSIPGVPLKDAGSGNAEIDRLLADRGEEYFTMEDPAAWQGKL